MTTVITGANRGIGLALAQRCATAGAAVVGTYRSTAPALQVGITWHRLEVTEPASHAALAKHLGGQPIELLVCNAGVYLEKGQKLESGFPTDQWHDAFAVNVMGVFLSVQSLLPNLRAAKGKIAIISSGMGSDARAPGGSYIYRASKAAALNLGRNLAADLKPDGIAVGIYHPGWVRTDMGGQGADIDVGQSAAGLSQRFAALSLATTGCFEGFDGAAVPF
jgi:NAD(P)-dependent dehydrogenase (short-subunit alcohol dehydrogenase family)